MTEDNQLHLEVVVQRRVPRDGSGRKPETKPETTEKSPKPEQRYRSPADGSRSGGHGSHRRHYVDYGSVSLGSMDGTPAPASETEGPALAPEETERPAVGNHYGADQRAFFNKYDALLKRRYATRNKGGVAKLLLFCFVLVVFVLVTVLTVKKLAGSRGNKTETMEIETMAVEQIDLGDLP